MSRETQAYILNTHFTNRINDGYKVLVKKRASDIDDYKMSQILEKMVASNHQSIYVVGCGLGDILVNISRLKPGVVVGGCEVSEIFKSFGENLFKVGSSRVNSFDIKEPPYHTLPMAALMVSVDYLTESPESVETVKDMLRNSRETILFDPYPVRQYITSQLEIGLVNVHVKHEEDYTTLTSPQEARVTSKLALEEDIFGSIGGLQCSGVYNREETELQKHEGWRKRVFGNKGGMSG
jgi:hypothetical protein